MNQLLMKKKRFYLFSLIPICLAIILFIPYKQALVFEYQNTGEVLAFIPLKNNDTFKMKYTHSIHLSSVVESYKITKYNQIKQYELMYENFAIGMPSDAGEGEVFEEKDGKYYIKNMNRTFPSFDLRVGKVKANHTIIFKEKEYPLKETITPGTWTRIIVKKVNIIQLMKGVNILES